MSLLVAITAGVGFVTSYLLLHAGLTQMSLRYFAAFAMAYLVFLGLLWLWMRTRAEDYSDILDILPRPKLGSSEPTFEGKGGRFGGGGASGSFDGTADATAVETSDQIGSVSDAMGSAGDADELAIPLFAIALLTALVLSSVWVIYSAPVLFAELLVDGVLAASLYRKLRGLETRHWLETAIRRTFTPFIVTTLIAVLTGWGMSRYAPDAKSIGEVLPQHKVIR